MLSYIPIYGKVFIDFPILSNTGFAPIVYLKEIVMKKTVFGIQIVFGLIFVVFGLNGFFQFLPMPMPPEGAMKYLGGLMAAPYFFPLLKGVEVVAGLALLANVFVPLALVVLAPIVLHIFLYHTILDPSGAVMAVALVVFLIALAVNRKESYKAVLAMR